MHGTLDLHQALVKSCNIYFQTLMGTMLDEECFPRYEAMGRAFGFGRGTGIEIEPRRRIEKRTFRFFPRHSERELIAAAIGQGPIVLTPAQIARAYAGLATGRLPTLFIVRRVGDSVTKPRRQSLPATPASLAVVRAALREVGLQNASCSLPPPRFWFVVVA